MSGGQMANIDVEAASVEWRRLGGHVVRIKPHNAVELRAGREIAAFVRPHRMRVYRPDAGSSGANVYDGSCLPELARVWGLGHAPNLDLKGVK